ncbi:MAG: hypothetical protein JSS60_07390 [Verrucomicrobia bacterium]|nr:hypothetical protein [Verrucomicrobiota bacterium]
MQDKATVSSVTPVDSKTKKASSVLQQPSVPIVPVTSKTVSKVLAHDTHGAQQRLVAAISRSTQKTETASVTIQKFVPNMERITELEKGVTEADKRVHNFTRHLVYYRHNDTYYFNALVLKSKIGGIQTFGQTLVEARDVKEHVASVKQSGSFDIGAVLRERMGQMGIGYREQ